MRHAVKWGLYLGFLLLVRCSDETPPAGPVTDSGPDAPKPTYTIEQLKDPATCKECHAKHYRDWSGSMHAYASDDPLFLAMNERGQREAKIDNFCVNCHAPMAVAAAPPNTVIDAAMLKALPATQRGITCYFCHSIDGVTDSHNNPLHLANDGVMRGRFTDAVPNEAHASKYSEFLDGTQVASSHACGSCHDIVNGHGTHIERTFEEWQDTVFSGPTGQQCAQCHVPQGPLELIADGPKAPGVFARKGHNHQMAAVDRAITDFPEIEAQKAAVAAELDRELQSAICVASLGADAKIAVLVDNLAAGHRFPSGAAQDRQVWFELRAYAGDKQVYQSGVVGDGIDPYAMPDDDIWLIRDCMFDPQGKQTHAFWEAKAYEFNTLPAQITLDQTSDKFYLTHVSRTFPSAASKTITPYPDRVTMKIWMQPFPYSVFDDHVPELERLGYDKQQISAMRAKLAPMPVSAQADPAVNGRELVWTPEIAADPAKGGSIFRNTLIPGIPNQVWMYCVTGTAMRTQVQIVSAPRLTTCRPP